MASSAAGDAPSPGKQELPVGSFVWWKKGNSPWQLGVRVCLRLMIDQGFLVNEKAIAQLCGEHDRMKDPVCIWSVAEGDYAICTPNNIRADINDEPMPAPVAARPATERRRRRQLLFERRGSAPLALPLFLAKHPVKEEEQADKGHVKDEPMAAAVAAVSPAAGTAGRHTGQRGVRPQLQPLFEFEDATPLASPPRGGGRRQRGSPGVGLSWFGAERVKEQAVEGDDAAGGGGYGMMELDVSSPSRHDSTTDERQWTDRMKAIKFGRDQVMAMLRGLQVEAVFKFNIPFHPMPRQPRDPSLLWEYLREASMRQYAAIAQLTPSLPSPLPPHGVHGETWIQRAKRVLEGLCLLYVHLLFSSIAVQLNQPANDGGRKVAFGMGAHGGAAYEQPAAAAAAAAAPAAQACGVEVEMPEGVSLYLRASYGLSVGSEDTRRKSLSLDEVAAQPPSQADIQKLGLYTEMRSAFPLQELKCRRSALLRLEDFVSILSGLQRDPDSALLFSHAADSADTELPAVVWSRLDTLRQLIESTYRLRYERDPPQLQHEQPAAAAAGAAAADGADEVMHGDDMSRHTLLDDTGGTGEPSRVAAALLTTFMDGAGR
ncbi:unnamed protein product [Vitrella brassicaformis CCMP3155]|uniref:Uncharacterized protein n=1 Tax=Vitrella brassicaformis (strain CCMP3155) TaxID=1169540 RepID=A0A0G4E9R0_VITBC|nr:unnamed protein product [Vitrella brassicaformis CCMP3155]|eukprot:CEL92381.1 unnamed protein product [Vitrella brassicaformis CCMP3155]